jgi:hypothetical protein
LGVAVAAEIFVTGEATAATGRESDPRIPDVAGWTASAVVAVSA